MKNETCNLTSNLYSPRFEHDACGIGAVVDTQGRPSHETVDRALKIVEKLEHRAGKDASGETGDGVGILVQISHRFFSAVLAELGVTVGQARSYAVGMFFLPQDRILRARRQKLFEILAEKAGLPVLLWRSVPVEPGILGQRAVDCMPSIWQPVLVRPADAESDLEFDRRLYIMRREFEQSVSDTYVASLSCRTIVYKGMFLVKQLRLFYPDLQDERFASAIALVHSRFSTNTNPSWERAHPNRLLLHNGEINTIRGNLSRMLAREETMHSPPLDHVMEKILPVVDPSGSDSAMLDNALEFLLYSGMDLPKAVMLTIPEPWSQNRDMPRAIQDMYHPYVKHTTKIFSLRLMDFQAQAYPDARRKTRGASQLHRGGQSRSPVRPLCNRKQLSCLLPQSKMSWILYAISMRLSGYTSTRSISSSASSVVSVSASKIALDASLRLSCRACSSCFCFACANTAA